MRVEGIPIWVTYYGGLIALLGTTLGIYGLVDPTSVNGFVDGAVSLATTWAGRNAGLGLVLAIAIYLRNAHAYTAAFFGSIFREVGDILGNIRDETGLVMLVVLGLFLLADLAAFFLSFRAMRKA